MRGITYGPPALGAWPSLPTLLCPTCFQSPRSTPLYTRKRSSSLPRLILPFCTRRRSSLRLPLCCRSRGSTGMRKTRWRSTTTKAIRQPTPSGPEGTLPQVASRRFRIPRSPPGLSASSMPPGLTSRPRAFPLTSPRMLGISAWQPSTATKSLGICVSSRYVTALHWCQVWRWFYA